MALLVKGLKVKIGNKEVLGGVGLAVARGEVVALMGPNGCGKSTLALALMGHPSYEITDGSVDLDGGDMTTATPDARSRAGLFLAVQYPVSIPGVSVREALLASLRARGESVSALEVKRRIEAEAKELAIDGELLKRSLNEGFSGGEKKKMEILQMRILAPKYAILDETDSGLDIDALKIVATGTAFMAKKKQTGILVITHYQRLLKYLKPDRVLVMKQGRIAKEGGGELVAELEKSGYKQYE
ncbi:MAG TPA: Fe-S cluster assembly ATPase SufC [Patescibacteria group bacterium]|nr:Fe-S cluster assembly ATPase SufC [Patescibacteria group bacterium]